MFYSINRSIKLLNLSLLLLAGQALISISCNKNTPRPCRDGYIFSVTSNWTPQKEIYRLGDTLFLSSSFSKTLVDQINTSMVVDYSNSVGIGGNLTLFELDSIMHQPLDAASQFDIYASNGRVFNHPDKPQRLRAFEYEERVADYALSLKVIPKKRGLYTFFVSELYSRGLKGKNCTNAGFGMTVINTDKHYTLYQFAMQQSPDDVQKKNIYCFRVQ